MASLSVEEENYVRISLLLTGVSPRAARTFFDSEFAPACLGATIKKEYNKLFDLKKKHVINQSQWNVLIPRSPDVPDSKTFDVTLMILLLRNLTPMTPPLCGFDRLPSAMETTPAADLARIKHYRNYLAHLDDGKLDTGFFNTAWNDLTCAIYRLGGQQMKHECDHLKTKPLDQTNQEIMMDIKHSNNEIWELKKSFESLKTSHTKMSKSHELLQEHHDMLQEDYTEVKKSHEILQDDHRKVKKSHEILQDDHRKVKKSHEILQDDHRKITDELEMVKTSQKDTVPWNIRDRINDTLKDWMDNDDKLFIDTRAAQYVLKCIKENSCVTITASSGVGKTATLRHVALQMAKEEFDVLLVTDPADIVRFCNVKNKTLFVFDDLCGHFSLDQSDINSWEPIMQELKRILVEKQTKILAACRLQVYKDGKFDCLSVFKSCVCNMLSENICLSKTEKQSIAKLYLNEKASQIIDSSDLYDCFPLLCKLYHDYPEHAITDFFQNPFSIYEADIDTFLKRGHYAKYCALALCVMFNNKLKVEMLTEEVNKKTRKIIKNTCEACRLDRGTSRLVLQDELDSLTDTFITKEQNMYKIIHDKLFDFLAKIYGQKIIYCLIKNADSGLIRERFLLESKDDMDQFITIIPKKYHQMYMQRMIDDWLNGKVKDVFSNVNMKIPQFKQNFLGYLHTLDKSTQRQLAHTCAEYDTDDDNVYDTALLYCCYIGDISLVEWCCNHNVNVNRCTDKGQSPVMIACEHGHTEIVKMLLNKGADYNKWDDYGESPLMITCENGHTDIVKILLDREVDYDEWDSEYGYSSLMAACQYGHIEIVKMLLDKGADINTCMHHGISAVSMACECGHTEIVKILLDRGADYNICDRQGQSPVVIACEKGYTEIVKILLDRGVDFNKCGDIGETPVTRACEHGHIEIVKILLDRGADYNKCEKWNGRSSMMAACEHGHTDIVNMLVDRGADFYQCEGYGVSDLIKACAHSRTEVVKVLLDREANVNACNEKGTSPLMVAVRNGHSKILEMLLDSGADYTECNEYDSPVITACIHGHTEILRILLDRGADYNECKNWRGQSPVMIAREHGNTDIEKILLDRGANYIKGDEYSDSPLMKACKQLLHI